MKRILLVDDHAVVRRGVEQLLASTYPDARFGAAESVQQALHQAAHEAWDLAILDLNLPGRGGLELIQLMKDVQPGLGILVFTMHPEDQLGVRSIRAGADGFVTKDSPPEELVRAAGLLLAGKRYISATLGDLLACAVATGTSQPAHELLSDREFQVLKMIASGKTPTEMANELSLSIKTVSTYRTRILEKLNAKSTAELIRYAIENHLA